MEQAQIESRMQSIREEIRQIQNSIDSCEQYGQGLRVSFTEIEELKNEMLRKMDRAGSTGQEFRMFRSLQEKRREVICGPAFQSMMEGLYGSDNEFRENKQKLFRCLEELEDELERLRALAEANVAEDTDG